MNSAGLVAAMSKYCNSMKSPTFGSYSDCATTFGCGLKHQIVPRVEGVRSILELQPFTI